jgi:hypothetical protein
MFISALIFSLFWTSVFMFSVAIIFRVGGLIDSELTLKQSCIFWWSLIIIGILIWAV